MGVELLATDRQSERGQSLAELAIVATPVLLLLLGILQFGLIYNAQVGLTNAVRDAARYGSQLSAASDSAAGTAASATRSFLSNSLSTYVSPYFPSNVDPSTAVCYSPYTAAGSQSAVRVTVSAAYNHPLIVPLVSSILDAIDGSGTPGTLRITSTTDLRVDVPLDVTPSLTGTQCS